MTFFDKSAQDTLTELHTDAAQGLSDAQVKENIERYGRNEFTRAGRKSLLRRIWEASTEPMLILLFFAWLITVAVNLSLIHISEPTRP